MSNAYVNLYDFRFEPIRLCDDMLHVAAGQVVLDGGSVIAQASRVYNTWAWTTSEGTFTLAHPGNDNDRLRAVNTQMRDILIGIAKRHNEIGEGK